MSIISYGVLFMVSVHITYQIKERVRLIFLILEKLFYEESSKSRKFKLAFITILLSNQVVIAYFMIIQSVIYLTILSSNCIEVLSNTLSALVLDQIDNMGSLILFNWVRTNYN